MIGLVILLGVASLVAGIVIIRRSSPHSRRGATDVCPRCGYAITGLPARVTCPECGTPAAEMDRLRSFRFPRREVLMGPWALCLIVYALSMAIGLWPTRTRSESVFLLVGPFQMIPYASLCVILLLVARRITPAAAWALATFSLCAFAPLLTILMYRFAIGLDTNPFAFIGLFTAPIAAVPLLGFGFLIGAVVIRHPLFKRPPAAQRKPNYADSHGANS